MLLQWPFPGGYFAVWIIGIAMAYESDRPLLRLAGIGLSLTIVAGSIRIVKTRVELNDSMMLIVNPWRSRRVRFSEITAFRTGSLNTTPTRICIEVIVNSERVPTWATGAMAVSDKRLLASKLRDIASEIQIPFEVDRSWIDKANRL
jgi:hypothetical protein